MSTLAIDKSIPLYTLENDPILKGRRFSIVRFEGTPPHHTELLVPHRNDFYLFVLVRHSASRHWVDTVPYILQDDSFYFTVPHQLIVKEEIKHSRGTAIGFTNEFLALQGNSTLKDLPIIRNPQHAHELRLNEADIDFLEATLAHIDAEHKQRGEWAEQMILAHMSVLLTYLSRLYTEQFNEKDNLPAKTLLRKFHKSIDTNFRKLHQVNDCASLLNVSAGHLSETVKIQSGKSAIAHIHERLVLEARRLLFHSDQSPKEIAYDLGFADASYFARFFKRETGTSPAAYRASTREMYQ